MDTTKLWQIRGCLLLLFLLSLYRPATAATLGTIRGRVVDPLGAAVPNAGVTLLQDNKELGDANTSQEGSFAFLRLGSGRYSVRVKAAGFESQDNPPVFLPPGGTVEFDVLLQVSSLRQQIVVSDTGTEVPESQVGASVSVIDRSQLESTNKLDLLEVLRTVPGMQVVQSGQRGGTTSIFVRGGDANFNKVLIDGVPVNDVGGVFEFANLASTGVDHLEILRGPNSVLYGSDALGSVINITSRHGTTTIPEIAYSVDGGNFGTLRQDASLAGAFRQFDYFSDFSRFDTRNSVPNDSFHNGTYAGNFGWTPNGSSSIRLTLRRTAVSLGDPNALDFFGIPDDSSQGERDTYVSVTAQNQTTERWHNLLRYADARIQFHFINPSPSGTPFNPFGFGPNFLGNNVTIRGANGFAVTGQAILDFGGEYPQLFNANTTRQSIYAQSDYSFNPNIAASFGFRYENERGFTEFAGSRSPTDRNNFSYFGEAHGNLRHRLYATAGVGFEDNAIFGFAATPRISLAYYLRRPSSNALFSETKLKFNFGKGIKEPSIFDEGSSLFVLLSNLPQGQGAALISKFSVSPIGPERSRSFDFGVQQGAWNDRARIGVTFFHESYFDLIEFVNASVLPQLGVPPEVAAASGFGASINSSSFRALGAEVQLEANLGRGFHVQGEYSYLDAVVTRSLSSNALQPAINPAFPTIPIGAFSPLIGGRPFSRAPHSGSLLIDYSRRRLGIALAGYFVSRQDSSTFLTDGFFGNSLLLPNRNLNAGYQKIDLSGRYAVNRLVTAYFSVENLFSQHYHQTFGFPSLPLTFRTGLKFTLGGERGWWK
jgi:vitamin B12 transporter